MMPIDIDSLTVEELEDLNDKIIERLKFLDLVNTHHAKGRFNLGAKVYFESSKHGYQSGTLIKFNQKTVSVLTKEGKQWNVPPQMLSPLEKGSPAINVIELKKK